jgi:hypothetical protein
MVPSPQESPPIPAHRKLLAGLLVGLLLSAGCGGRLVDGVYRAAHDRYRVQAPPAPWVATSVASDELIFRHPALLAAIALISRCNNPEPGELPWVARHLFFGLRDQRLESRETESLQGAPAIRTRLQARLDGAPVAVEALTVRRGGCLYDFVYVAPPGAVAAGRPAFEAFVQSWTPGGGP